MEIAGHKVNTWMVVGGVGAVGLIFYMYKRSGSGSSSSAGSSGTTATGTDPVTGLPYSEDNQVDPVTGMTYLAEAQQYGSVSAAESAMEAGSSYGYGAAGQSGYVGTSGFPTSNVGTATGGVGSYSTNAQWAQAVTAGLTQLGYSSTDVAAALGLFFSQQPLGSGADGVSYSSIVQAAEAEFGPPPQGTYSIIPEPSSGGSVSSSSGSTTGGTPTPSGGKKPLPAPSDVHVTNKSKSEFSLAWNPVAGATNYRVAVTQMNGVKIVDFDVPGPGCTIGEGTHPGFEYNVGIQALPGGVGTNIHVTLPSK